MPSHQRNHTAVIRWLLFVCLLYSGSRLGAQIEAPSPVPSQEASSQTNDSSDDSELKIHNYQLKYAKAAEVLKLFKQLHGVENGATVDERTNSIVFLANETNARELRESLALLDGDAPPPFIPPTPVVQGSSPKVPSPAKSKPAGPFRKFTFKHAKVADVLKILREVAGSDFNDDMDGFVVDERTNSFIWKVEDVSIDFEEECSKLDIESPEEEVHRRGNGPTPVPPAPHASQVFNFSMGFERGESLESLKQRYSEFEQKAHQLADKLKQSTSLSESDRIELQQAVRKSFEARQALQRAELADLAQRMKSMQQSIDMRDKLADKVIERRIEDLLNPNLKWDLLAAKDRTLDGHNSESSNGSATTAQSAPETPALTPESSAYLPPSIASTPISVPYDPGKRPETIIMERIQGEWIAESMISAGKDSLSDYSEPFEVLITGNEMRFKVGEQDLNGPIPMLLTGPQGSHRSLESADQPLPMDFVMDPNGEQVAMHGIIASDGLTLSICFADEDESKSGFRPSSFIPGSKVVVIKCYRLTPTVPANKPGAANLSTPQATLDYLHRYSLAHPDGFPAECYTDEALLELSGMMLQNLSMMSAMSQIALQTGGVIGESNGVPVVSDTSPAFHIGVETLLKEHMLPTPPESADKAFELLATHTFGGDSSNPTAAVKVDRRLLRLAAGVLKSPKEFLPAAGKLLETFGETAADVTKSQKADQTPPKTNIAINGDEATATFTSSGNVASPSPLSKPRVTKLRRIDGRWLISEILSDQEITQMQSSMSSVIDQLGGAEAKFDTPQALLTRVDESSKAGSYADFIALFSDEGVRDLAGSMLMQAVMQTSIDELSRQLTFGGVAEDEPNFVAFRKVLQRWLPQSVTTAQQEAMGKGLSTIMSSTVGGSPDHAALNEFVISLRESVAGIGDHRKFCIEIMQAFEKLTKRKFVFFGNADHENEWQISPFADRAIATLIDGSPGMATTITLQQSNSTWSISSLFNELVIDAKPATTLASSTAPTPSTAKTVTRRYSVGSFVTEGFFTGKGSFDLNKEYDEYENEIEQSLQDLAKTVTAACTQPPKFVQVVSSTRSLLIGHTEAGHEDIANFMRDIGINNDRIRLRGVFIEITQDEAKSLSIDLAQHVLSIEESRKLNEFAIGDVAKRRKHENKAKRGDSYIDFVAMDESIYSGTRTPVKHIGLPIPLTVAARISPATRQIQIRLDMPFGDENERGFASKFQTLTDGQSVLFEILDDSYWLVTADIVPESTGSFSGPAIENGPHTTSTSEPKYSGHPISWWLDSYWDNAMASPKAAESIAQEYVASEAIRQLREKPECKAAIEAALAKWFASVEHEVNEVQLTRAAKCFVTAAGPEYQELAVHYLCKIWSQLPTLSLEKQVERLGEETELNDLLKQLVRNDALAIQFAERLSNGTSSDRSLVTYYLFCSIGVNDKDPKIAELNTWLHHHRELFVPAFTAALKDESEQVRLFSLSSLLGLDQKLISLPSTLTTLTMVVESDSSPLVRGLAIGMFSTKEMLSQVKSQNIEIAPLMIKTLEHDPSIDVRYAALEALMAMDTESELVHKTLMEWAKSEDHQKVKYALDLTLRNYQEGNRPQSSDELIDLLSDPEWGTTVEINYNNWSTHHRWARQYAIAILGQYAAHAHRAIPTLEAELARNNKDTLSFATEALDRVRGYCPDLPIDQLQGEWEFVAMEKPEGSTPIFDFQASSDQQPSSVITITGTQLKLGDRVLAEISHYRTGSRQGMQLLLDPDGRKLHCNGSFRIAGGASPSVGAATSPQTVTLEVCELHNEHESTQATKQTYELQVKELH